MRIVNTTLVVLLTLSAHFASATSINYVKEGFDAAKNRAQAEGKMLLVDFYADWCAPCKWMDQTTFSDPTVIKKMNDDYITVKINIDDFDGYALKEHYGVTVLPTVIIIDNSGKVIERVEETIPPAKMNDILERNKGDVKKIVHTPNTNPESLEYNIDSGLSGPSNSTHYKLQLGTFTDYASTLEYFNHISKVIDDQIIVLHDYKGNNIIYRVLTGNFANTTEAEIYKTELLEKFDIKSYLYY